MTATPTLQGLPQELLELIFLYSMNISLPRASDDLGAKLSSPAMCTTMCMRTFFSTVDHKAPIRDRKTTSDPILQSEILTCRFFTYSFFLSYVARAHDALVKQRGKPWQETSVSIPSIEAFDDGLWPFKFTKIKYLGFAVNFRIPEKLLHGPFTPDKSNLLYVLVSLSGSIDWEGSMAGEIAKEGLKDAIREGNERAVAGLSVLLGIAKEISTQHVRFAVLECGCDLNIMRHLLFNAQILYGGSPTETLDMLDPVLWRWADERQEEDDSRGSSLKMMLKRASKFDLEFYESGETDWKSIIPFPYSGEKFDARTAFDRIVRELLTRLYRNHGRKITRAALASGWDEHGR
jgi:large subunit ribosomal protein L14e